MRRSREEFLTEQNIGERRRVRYVRDARPVRGNGVRGCNVRMVESRGGNLHVVDFELRAVVQLAERYTGARSVERHGEERRIGLRGENAAQVLVVALTGVHEQTVAFPIERRKERQPLDVVPVRVADQDMR